MVNASCRCFAGQFRHRGKVEDELAEIFYDLFSLSDNQTLPYQVSFEYGRIIKRVNELKHLTEFGLTYNANQATTLEKKGILAWQKALIRWKADNAPKD